VLEKEAMIFKEGDCLWFCLF